MAKRVITANRLGDGAVVWRDARGRWREDIDRAAASADDAAVARMLSDARAEEAAGVIIAPYDIEVDIEESADGRKILPARLRERIRAAGPTVALS